MYETNFSLNSRPFLSAPVKEAYFPSESMEKCRKAIVRAIEREAGPCLIVGPSGVGKTMLCSVLNDQFKKTFRTALLSCSRMASRRALLQCVLFELGLPYRGMEEGELRLTLLDHLEPSDRGPSGLLLIVDEAHLLSVRLLEELRLLTNMVREGKPRVRVVLAGNPSLEERFANPRLESFNQRIAARCYLDVLGSEETTAYVQEQIRRVGGEPAAMFTEESYNAIYEATGGVLRLINQVCEQSLMLASLSENRQVDRVAVEEAWSDLQQLPVPWQIDGGDAAPSGIVEYGPLDGAKSNASAESANAAGQPDPFAQIQEIESSLQIVGGDEKSAWAEAASANEIREGEVENRVHELSQARSLRPEVELFFHDAHDPLSEHYVEEEIVLDQFSSIEDAPFTPRTRVRNLEGDNFANVLSSQSATNELPRMCRTDAEATPVPNAERTFEVVAYDVHPEDRAGGIEYPHFDVQSVSAETPTTEPFGGVISEDYTSDLAIYAATTPEAPTEKPENTAFEDDRDLIIVEDIEETETGLPVGKIRRQEYRQLFTSLRDR